MVSDQRAEKISRMVKSVIRKSKGNSRNISIKVEPCPSSGWTSERYILTARIEGERNQQYYCKCYSIKDKSVPFIKRYLENEYRGLQFAHHCFKSTTHFCAPRPIALFENEKTILMEYLKGKNLLAHTNDEFGKFGFKKVTGLLSSYYQKAGEMLRLFQDVSSTFTSSDDGDNYANKEIFKTGISAISELTSVGISKAILDDYKDYMITLEQNYRINDLLPVHWDFRPQNIIIEEKTNRLGLIDFQLFTNRGNPFRDPATFVLNLIAYDILFFRKSNLFELISRFFSGYLTNGKPFKNFSMDLLDIILQIRFPWQINSLIRRTSTNPFQNMKNKIICFKSERILRNILSTGSILRGYYRC